MKTLRELCPAGNLTRIEQALATDHDADLPWYLRFIIGVGAWVASLFFLGFSFTLIGWENKDHDVLGATGIVLLVAAVLAGRQKWGLFADQSALAVSFAAQAMIYIAFVAEQEQALRSAMILAIGLAAILYVAFPNSISRWLTCFGALQVTLLWIQTGDHGGIFFSNARTAIDLALLSFVYWAVHLAGICGLLIFPRAAKIFAPLAYALVISLAVWQLEPLWDLDPRPFQLDASNAMTFLVTSNLRVALVAFALMGVAVWVAGGRTAVLEHAPLFLGLAVAIAAFIYLGLGGVLPALLLMLLGFALQDRLVLSIGLVLFPVFLAHYYYQLDLDLLAKSGVLVGSGAVMLIVRVALQRWAFAGREAA